MSESAMVATALAALAGLGVFLLIICVVLYVFKSIGLAVMAQNRGIENPWLAWLPIADLYLMGTLVEEMNLFGMQITNLGLWYPVVSLVGGLLAGIPFLGIILLIGLIIFQIVFMFNLFKQYTTQATLLTVLSIFFGFLWPIFIFALRNNTMISNPNVESVPPLVRENVVENETTTSIDSQE